MPPEPGPDPAKTPAATPPATPPSSATPPSATPAATGLPADPGHLGEEHFKHPEYGAALKNLHNGFREKSEKYAALEREHGDLQAKLEQVKLLFQNPAIAQAVRAHFSGQQTTPDTSPTEPPQEPSTDENTQLAALEERILTRIKVQQAQDKIMQSFGGLNGFATSAEGAAFQQLAGRLLGDDPLARADAMLEYFRLTREAASRPTPSPAGGTANSETGRGNAAGAPAVPSEIKSGADMIRALGFASESDYYTAMGGVR